MAIRKLSLTRRGSSSDIPSLEGQKKGKPPKARSGSEPPEDTSASPVKDKRRMSLGTKSKRRLSSIFSSSTGGSDDRRTGASSPRRPSHLSQSASTSGASTPPNIHITPSDYNAAKYASLDSRGAPPRPPIDMSEITSTTGSLHISSSTLSQSPISTAFTIHSSAVTSSAIIPPEELKSISSSRACQEPSLYTQWDDEDADSTNDDDVAYLTPSEGLSEVEEEDEEEEEGSGGASQTFPHATATAIIANGGPRTGGGPKIHRSQAGAETKVYRRQLRQGNPADVDQAAVLADDLDLCRRVLSLFLTSNMKESEQLIEKSDPDNTHMYLQSAHGIIQGLKGMMTFDANDLGVALDICKATSVTASSLRRPTEGFVSKLGGLVRSGHALARLKAMTPLERHAELVYAETALMKALLAIISGGDWMGLIKEALNMRTAHGIYRSLQHYLEDADKNGFDDDIDMDFRSGVLLGTGTSSLMLSLLPGKVLKIAEVFGYAGDRTVALETLMAAGGWSPGKEEPAFDESNEGIRRPVCDMILLTFHLVISVLMPVAGVDVTVARNILAYNMRRYPNGVFFLYFQARLHTSVCEPELANACLQRALDLDLEYVQLQHMCLWDFGCNYFQLGNWDGARQCFDILRQESNWSRAVYTYATAACIMELVEDGAPNVSKEEAEEFVRAIPKLTKKIAGKSLPIEKLVSRKSRKFLSQGDRLFLPAMELGYVFGSLGTTPRRTLVSVWLPRIDCALSKLEASTPESYGGGNEYWDDFALGHFLRGMVQFVARYQPREAAASAREQSPGGPTDEELDAGAERDFNLVIKHSPEIQLDHYIIYHCHYELGRLYARRGDKTNARRNFEVVSTGKLIVPNSHASKAHGKYSLEGALQLKTHAAVQSLKET